MVVASRQLQIIIVIIFFSPTVILKEMKLLGVIIDHKLIFNNHITHICHKAIINLYKFLARSAKISCGLNPTIIRIIYVAVVETILNYN